MYGGQSLCNFAGLLNWGQASEFTEVLHLLFSQRDELFWTYGVRILKFFRDAGLPKDSDWWSI